MHKNELKKLIKRELNNAVVEAPWCETHIGTEPKPCYNIYGNVIGTINMAKYYGETALADVNWTNSIKYNFPSLTNPIEFLEKILKEYDHKFKK